MPRHFHPVVVTALAGAAVTLAVVAIPAAHFAYRNPELHIALLTAEALIASLAAYLMFGRFRRRARLSDLLLAVALGTLALANLFFAAVPAVFASDESVFSTWAALIARLLGAAALAMASQAPTRRLGDPRRAALTAMVGMLAGFGIVAVVVGVLVPHLPQGVDVMLSPESSARPRLESRPEIVVAQVASALLFAIAAVGYSRAAQRSGDMFEGWLAIGCVIAAFGRVHYLLFPSLFTDWVSTGDLFRLAFYLVILAAAANEIRSYWRSLVANAAGEERRRVARDLHDGLAQEVASIQRNLRWMDPGDEFVARAGASAERALVQVRRAIRALDETAESSLQEALDAVARTVGEREDVRVEVDVPPNVVLPAAAVEAMAMIVSEAATNAAQHGGCELVRVEVEHGPPLCLRVRDQGRGFIMGDRAIDSGGMGLRVMEARAQTVGATLRVESEPGRGTCVEVLL